MEGQWIRLNRLFSGSRRTVIVAMDHGEFVGPTPGIIDAPEAIQALTEADGVLLSPGMMSHCGSFFARRNAPQAIVRLNWSTVYCVQSGYDRAAPQIPDGHSSGTPTRLPFARGSSARSARRASR